MEITLTDQEKDILKKRVELTINKKSLNLNNKEDVFRLAKMMADNIISKETLGFAGWDTLADTNSLWDIVEPGINIDDLINGVVEKCEERLGEDGFDAFGLGD